jgi:hypothetical protein
MAGRLPRTLLKGMLRTSTLVLSVLFVGLLVLYLQVRPVPGGVGNPGGSTPTQPAPSRSPTSPPAPESSTRDTGTTAPTSAPGVPAPSPTRSATAPAVPSAGPSPP